MPDLNITNPVLFFSKSHLETGRVSEGTKQKNTHKPKLFQNKSTLKSQVFNLYSSSDLNIGDVQEKHH